MHTYASQLHYVAFLLTLTNISSLVTLHEKTKLTMVAEDNNLRFSLSIEQSFLYSFVLEECSGAVAMAALVLCADVVCHHGTVRGRGRRI